MVYEDAEEYYAEVSKKGHKLLDDAIDALLHPGSSLPLTPANSTAIVKQGPNGSIVALNTTPFSRRDVIQLPLTDGSTASQLKSAAVQVSVDGKTGYAIVQADTGFGIARPRGMFADCDTVSGDSHHVSPSITLLLTNLVGSEYIILRRHHDPQLGGRVGYQRRQDHQSC